MITWLLSREFLEWCEFLAIEPTGWVADSQRSGTVAAAISGSVPRKPTKARPLQASDFFPPAKRRPRRKQQSAGDLMALFRGLSESGLGTFTEAS